MTEPDTLRQLEDAEEQLRDLRKALITQIRESGSDQLVEEIVEVFDAISISLGLPISNDDGVPYELLPTPPEPGFSPTMTVKDGWYIVTWGSTPIDRGAFDDLQAAAECFARSVNNTP